MQLGRLPLFDELASANRILLAGAGGGFDVFCGLPLYFALRSAGKKPFLANLTFSPLPSDGLRLSSNLLEVTADTRLVSSYFPELFLAKWFRQRGDDTSIFCFERTGAIPLRESCQMLTERLELDAVILVDGGTDSLMRGDEYGLGTPHEDIASIAAVDDINVPLKLLVCVGFGVDANHDVCHAHYLEAVAQLIKSGDFLGAFSLLRETREAELFKEACEFVFEQMPEDTSIVSTSVLSAIAGEYGDFHSTDRTRRAKLWINPLMSLYWCFRLPGVAARIQYLSAMKKTETWDDVQKLIQHVEATRTRRPFERIPI